MATTDITAGQDRIDSRDVLKLIDQLADGEEDGDLDDAETAELESLRMLVREIEDYASESPEDGVSLVADWDFENYAQELAEDLDLIKSDASWPNDCIDWAKAARELRIDYTAIEWEGFTYWLRS